MSDFYNNGSNEPEKDGSYSYKKDEINQGESFYQWSPYDDGKKNKKAKKSGGFIANPGRARKKTSCACSSSAPAS